NSLKLRFQPVLESLKQSFLKSRKVHCYTDLRSEVERKGLTERLLLLEFRYRATGRLDLKEWRRLLFDEVEALKEAGERAIPRIIDESEGSPHNLALYSGFLDGVNYIGRRNFDVEIVLLKEYWKSPLDTLRTMAWKHGVENIPDETIETYLKLHKKYTDLVLKLPEIDQAHEVWSRRVQTKRRLEEGRSASSLRRSGLVGMDDWRRPSNLEEDRP
ncbi:MAG: hypothetical protein QW390_00945, partial [Candidatus Bathyarchaeia archaeon]